MNSKASIHPELSNIGHPIALVLAAIGVHA